MRHVTLGRAQSASIVRQVDQHGPLVSTPQNSLIADQVQAFTIESWQGIGSAACYRGTTPSSQQGSMRSSCSSSSSGGGSRCCSNAMHGSEPAMGRSFRPQYCSWPAPSALASHWPRSGLDRLLQICIATRAGLKTRLPVAFLHRWSSNIGPVCALACTDAKLPRRPVLTQQACCHEHSRMAQHASMARPVIQIASTSGISPALTSPQHH